MNSILPKLHAFLSKLKTSGSLLLPFALLAVFLGGWWIGRPASSSSRKTADAAANMKWTCSMHPFIRQDGPGLCPVCEMDLIPVSASGGGGLRDIVLSPDAVARLDIRVAPTLRQPATKKLRFLGRVVPDERQLTTTTARMDGRLDRLFVDYTGISVKKGNHLAEIYSPDLYVAQDELIQARRNLTTNADRTRQTLYRAAREKLRLLGIPPGQIDAIERQTTPTDHVTLNAPQDGVVTKLHKREGDYIKTGEPLFSLADLSSVWIILEAYEDDLPWLRFAQDASFKADAVPGQTFTGRIAFIDPVLDETRRITRVRVNVPNPDGTLKPGMFVRGEVTSVLSGDRVINPALAGKWISPMHPEIIRDAPGHCDICGMDLVPAEELGFRTTQDADLSNPLLVPASAVLQTGDRAVIYRRISTEEGITFEGREVVLGPRSDDYFIVESGLREGDLVVTRGAFKLDSELQIQARPAMMLEGQSINESSALSPPKTVSGAWKPVLRALSRAREHLHDEALFLNHLGQARAILTAIQPEFLPDDYEPLWREASMKLENLFAQTHRDAKKSGTQASWEDLLRSLPETTAIAGLNWQLPELHSLPANQLTELNAILDSYLPITRLLAHDKPAEAIAATPALITALRSSSFPALEQSAPALSKSTDEATLRTSIKDLTDALRPILRESANDQLGPLYLVHCPMAFKNTGADWLSRQPIVENPYFGSRMFSCGDVTETLSLPAAAPARPVDHSDHSGHQHTP